MVNSLELKLKRELSNAMSALQDEKKKHAYTKGRLELQDRRVIHYMNVNGTLWLRLSELPGGLEIARKITLEKKNDSNFR